MAGRTRRQISVECSASPSANCLVSGSPVKGGYAVAARFASVTLDSRTEDQDWLVSGEAEGCGRRPFLAPLPLEAPSRLPPMAARTSPVSAAVPPMCDNPQQGLGPRRYISQA